MLKLVSHLVCHPPCTLYWIWFEGSILAGSPQWDGELTWCPHAPSGTGSSLVVHTRPVGWGAHLVSARTQLDGELIWCPHAPCGTRSSPGVCTRPAGRGAHLVSARAQWDGEFTWCPHAPGETQWCRALKLIGKVLCSTILFMLAVTGASMYP